MSFMDDPLSKLQMARSVRKNGKKLKICAISKSIRCLKFLENTLSKSNLSKVQNESPYWLSCWITNFVWHCKIWMNDLVFRCHERTPVVRIMIDQNHKILFQVFFGEKMLDKLYRHEKKLSDGLQVKKIMSNKTNQVKKQRPLSPHHLFRFLAF